MTDEVPAKVSASFKQLQTAARALNAVSDELGRSIAALDEVLKKLNLGITTWVDVSTAYGGGGEFETQSVGYAKVGSTWGMALRRTWGRIDHDDEEHLHEDWLFNDAPRALRVAAVDKLADVLDALAKDADATTKNIFAKIRDAEAVVEAITGAKLSTAPPKTLASIVADAETAEVQRRAKLKAYRERQSAIQQAAMASAQHRK